MAVAQLRVYPYEGQTGGDDPETEASVSIRLREFLPVLDRAFNESRSWLRDFHDDEVRVSSDLYEVLRAFAKV